MSIIACRKILYSFILSLSLSLSLSLVVDVCLGDWVVVANQRPKMVKLLISPTFIKIMSGGGGGSLFVVGLGLFTTNEGLRLQRSVGLGEQ